MNILEEIAKRTGERIEEEKRRLPLEELRRLAEEKDPDTGFPFQKALAGEELSFICEVKKASPSKGVIAEDFPYVEIARQYEAAGAAALSVLTEPYYFQGSDDYLREIRREAAIPILRKDFTVDEYMIYQAKVMGADAVLLICAILTDEQLSSYGSLAKSLGLSALVEAHDEAEVKRALAAGASIVGVNNRNLKDFTVDIENSVRLRPMVPKEVLFVSESGIKTGEDVGRLKRNGTNAVLVGETLMRSMQSGSLAQTLRKLQNG